MSLRAKLRRFFYVRLSAKHRVMHRVFKTRYQPVEGDLTACGVSLSTKSQWITPLMGKLPRCKRCENAAG